MRIRTLLLSVVWSIVLSGCAMSPAQQQAVADRNARFLEGQPKCFNDKDCERMFAAARSWVVSNCGMKIQNITDSYIETYNSTDGNTALHCRVSKDPFGQDGWVLSVTTGCGNLFGCYPDSWAAAFDFNAKVSAVAPRSDPPPLVQPIQ